MFRGFPQRVLGLRNVFREFPAARFESATFMEFFVACFGDPQRHSEAYPPPSVPAKGPQGTPWVV